MQALQRVYPADELAAEHARLDPAIGVLSLALPTPMFRLYARVLGLLGPQMRLGWCWRSPMSRSPRRRSPSRCCSAASSMRWPARKAQGGALDWPRLTPLVAAWVGFGLFLIVCGALVSLYADKLAHKRRQAVLSDYFEHVLQLPLSFHSATHSGRLMKVMLTGTDTLWWLWLGFFREHLAAIVSIAVLLPLALYLNWRLGLLLIGLSLIFLALTVFVLRKTEAMQKSVERYYSDLAERASDTLGNVALVQSFTRVEDEVRELRAVVERLLGAQMPVLSWWALVSTLTKASTTLTMLAILILGLFLFARGQTTIGAIVMFMSFAGMLIQRLEQAARFVNSRLYECAEARGILRRARHHDFGEGSQEGGDLEDGARRGRLRRRHLLL